MQRDPHFDDAYWSEVVEDRAEEHADQKAFSGQDPEAFAVPLVLLSAAVAASRAALGVLAASYSGGITVDRVHWLEEARASFLRARELHAVVDTDDLWFDVASRREVYDWALGLSAWAVLLDRDVPDVSLWTGASRDALLVALASGPAGVEGATLWPRTYGPLAAALRAPGDAGEHVRAFLQGWLTTSRGTAWAETLQQAQRRPGDLRYQGHWAVEAAAVVELLGLDDSSFRDAPHYPADLVRATPWSGEPSSDTLRGRPVVRDRTE